MGTSRMKCLVQLLLTAAVGFAGGWPVASSSFFCFSFSAATSAGSFTGRSFFGNQFWSA